MELGRLNETLLSLFQEAIVLQGLDGEAEPINSRFQARNGFLEASHDDVFKADPRAILELFLILQQRPELQGVRASTIRLIRAHRYLIDEDFRNDPEACALFSRHHPPAPWTHPRAQKNAPLRTAGAFICRCSAPSKARCNMTFFTPTR